MPRKKPEAPAEEVKAAEPVKEAPVVKAVKVKTSGRIQYKCRRCGETFLEDENCVSVKHELQRLTMTTYRQMFAIHDCADGNIGLAETIGAIYDK